MQTSHTTAAPTDRDKGHSIESRLDALESQIAYLVDSQRRTEALVADMTPIARMAMGSAIARLDALEKDGTLAFGRELVGIGQRVVEHFSPEDVRRLGDATVGILETVRALTQPEVLKVAGEAAAVLAEAEHAEPIGLVGMVRATGDHDVQKGMSVMVELMRHVGRAVSVTMEKRSQATEDKKKRLEAVLGSKRSRKKAIGVERTPAPRPVAKAAPPPAAPGAVLDGVAFGADGHLADPSAWTPALGDKIAALAGVTLTDAHRKVIAFARSDFEATGMSPNIRRITQLLGVSTRDLYTLFPKAPGRTIAKIAGIPKPAGCL